METIDELIEDIQTAETEIQTAIENPLVDPKDTIDSKRSELIRQSENGDIDQNVKYLQKASAKVIEKLYRQMEAKRVEKANAFITDLLISKFATLLGGLNAIESSEALDAELQNDKLLKQDVEKAVAMITPFIPALGIVSGGITVGKHVGEKLYGNVKPAEPPVEA